MALLKITCTQCKHTFYRIMVQCNREGVDLTCPMEQCGSKEGQVEIIKTKDGKSPFAPCSHT